jgi:basic amino acid/polyamine antiporter, APA family
MVITLFLTSSFSKVLNYVMFFDSIALISAVAAVFVLRHRAKNKPETGVYKIPLYPWMPIVFIITYTLVNVSIIVSNPGASLIGIVLFISGWPLYFVLKKMING